MREIYLDNSATTALCEEAKAKMTEAMEVYGNPSSLHPLGQAAKKLLEDARAEILKTLGAKPGTAQLFFTSCGTEADNLAVIGSAYAKERRKGGKIISTDSEHPAVEEALKRLEADGFEVFRVPTKGGVLDFEAYEKALDGKVFLVTMMAVNNETGARYDLEKAFRLAKAMNPDVVTHCDAVQGYLKYAMTPASIHADLMTLSSHKIHGPKGVGALFVSKDAMRRRDVVPTLPGGGQEQGFRSGTENIIGIAGFGAAAKAGFAHLSDDSAHLCDLRNFAEEQLGGLGVRFNIPAGERAPHILHLTLPQIRSETMLHALSFDGICVSAGSACSSHSGKVSRALLAFGLSAEDAESSIRISFSHFNTRDDVLALRDSLSKNLDRLVRIKR